MNERNSVYEDNFTKGRANGGFFQRTHMERRNEVFSADWRGRVAIHERVAAQKGEAMQARRELGAAYLEAHSPEIVVPFDTAGIQVGLAKETRAAREESLQMAVDKESQVDNKSLEFPVLAKDFPVDSPSLQLAMSPLMLAPVVSYFGMLPVFFNMFVTRAHTTELLPGTAHRFHLDPEDTLTHKIFIHLTEVDEDCGPLHVLAADATQTVLEAVNYHQIDRVDDERVKELVGWDRVMRVLGPPGTVAFADTSRCLHFGGRPRAAGKPIRYHLVFQYLLPTSFLFPINGDCQHPRFMPALEATGDDHWDALIGARFTDVK